MKVLVTGITNFIAIELAQEFSSNGWEVHGTSRRRTSPSSRYIDKVHAFNLTQPENHSIDLKLYDLVLHLAWDYSDNDQSLLGTKALFTEAEKNGVKKQLLISSYSAKEGSISPYGLAKYKLEEVFLSKQQLICRPGLVIGRGGLYFKLSKLIKKFPLVPIVDKHQKQTPYISVGDLALSIRHLVETNPENKIGNFFVYRPILIYHFAKEIAEQHRRKRFFINTPLFLPILLVRILNFFRIPFPISLENLKGLQQNQDQIHESNLKEFLAREPDSMKEAIQKSIQSISLEDEARFLYLTFFQEEIPHSILTRYVEAHQHMFQTIPSDQETTFKRCIGLELDFEAIEIALRHQQKPEEKHLMTKKIHALIYLAEFEPEHFDTFVNQKDQLVKGYLVGVLIVLTTVYKFIKGHFLIKRYQLV